MQTERRESMSPDGFLRLFREDDGDIIIIVGQGEEDAGVCSIVSVQFCTPFSGGGGSENTYYALIQLMGAMARDNLDPVQVHRRPKYDYDVEEQKKIQQWAEQCVESKDEIAKFVQEMNSPEDGVTFDAEPMIPIPASELKLFQTVMQKSLGYFGSTDREAIETLRDVNFKHLADKMESHRDIHVGELRTQVDCIRNRLGEDRIKWQ